MGWVYSQRTGQISHNGIVIGRGYSGIGAGKNNPHMQNVGFQGPIPRGMYHIGQAYAHSDLGPVTMDLTPIGHNACGRILFRIHGDNSRMNFTASTGCIILSRPIRERIANSGDTRLEVIY